MIRRGVFDNARDEILEIGIEGVEYVVVVRCNAGESIADASVERRSL
jgi:hypothetical protein